MKLLHPSSKRVILTVWCAHCSDEGRATRERLGQVEMARSGIVLWVTDRRSGMEAAQRLSVADPVLAAGIEDVLPAELPAGCSRHGHGTVSRSDVTGKVGSVKLHLNGPRAAL